MTNPIALLLGWLLDLLFGDPQRLPHPIVWFGKAIAFFEHRLNKGSHRKLKGAFTAITLIACVFIVTWFVRSQCSMFNGQCSMFNGQCSMVNVQCSMFNGQCSMFNGQCSMFNGQCSMFNGQWSMFNGQWSMVNGQWSMAFDIIIIFYCLAGTTLIREVRAVFLALDRSLDEGRKQVARIVGRDTSELSAQEVRTAALETLAENLSDGVIAPLFWLAVLGTPGMLAYKMVNTLDSMIGYKTERYRDFGCVAAHIDDVANYIPARLTALLMGVADFSLLPFHFSLKYGRNHASPNSGYPEAALAGILNCRFGGPHYYFGELFDKPYIGENDRELTTADMKKAVRINRTAEVLMVILTALCLWVCH